MFTPAPQKPPLPPQRFSCAWAEWRWLKVPGQFEVFQVLFLLLGRFVALCVSSFLTALPSSFSSERSPPSSSRYLRLCLALLLCLPPLWSCGEVVFVPSPYSVQKLQVLYSQQEDVTLFRWKLGGEIDRSAVSFELWQVDAKSVGKSLASKDLSPSSALAASPLASTASSTIDSEMLPPHGSTAALVRAEGEGEEVKGHWEKVRFEDAPFLSGAYSCGHDTCYSLSIPGKYVFPENGIILRSLHPRYGSMLSAPTKLKTKEQTLSFAPRFRSGNKQLELGVSDELSEPDTPLRRPFRWALAPAAGSCPDKKPASAPWTTTVNGNERVRLEKLKKAESWCVWLSPESKSHPSVSLVAQTGAHPNLSYRSHRYEPPVEVAPLVWKLVFDLEIPNESRCASTVKGFEEVLKKEFEKRDRAAHQLPSLFLQGKSPAEGGSCQQDPLRRLPSAEIAEEIKRHIRSEVKTQAGTRVLVVYVNNSGLPLSPVLYEDWWTVKESIADQSGAHSLLLAWGSLSVLGSGPWDEGMQWIGPSEKHFREEVELFAQSWLPFRTMLHDPEAPVWFMERELAKQQGWVKLCSSTPKVSYAGSPRPPGFLAHPVGPAEPFGYRVPLEPQLLVPHSHYLKREVRVHYEHCSEWCTHPFRDAGGEWQDSWLTSTACSEGM